MKLHLLGASGSGVTTLGQAISDTLSVPYFDSDDYFWLPTEQPFTARRSPAERNAKIRQDLSQTESWILGGSVLNWGDDVFPSFDLVVFLYLSPATRMERLRQREYKLYGNILDTDPTRKEQFERFLAWAEDYDNETGLANRTLSAHKNWLVQLTCPVLEMDGDDTTREQVAKVEHLFPIS